jgi:hypothetical protein
MTCRLETIAPYRRAGGGLHPQRRGALHRLGLPLGFPQNSQNFFRHMGGRVESFGPFGARTGGDLRTQNRKIKYKKPTRLGGPRSTLWVRSAAKRRALTIGKLFFSTTNRRCS